jgi:AcrR family transcriptional regulator
MARVLESSRPVDERRVGGVLGREHLAQLQRARIVSAMADVVLEFGAGEVSVAHVVERSGVSRRTFYDLFSDREECFLAAFDDALARIARTVVPAFESSGAWHERIRAGLTELLGLFDGDPGLGRLTIVESLAAGPRVLARRNTVLARLIGIVDEGRSETGAGSGLPGLSAEGVVGAVVSILYARLATSPSSAMGVAPIANAHPGGGGEREPLMALRGSLMSMIVLPYLGKAAAGRELARALPVPRTTNGADSSGVFPFRDLGLRVTYRTLVVLEAVWSNPGASNRQLGDVAGVSDQGQMSKLLARLQRAGLLINDGAGHVKGEPNAWHLTGQGRALVDAIEPTRGS